MGSLEGTFLRSVQTYLLWGEKLTSMEGEVDQTLKRVNGELRMIGSRLDRIDKKLPDFDLKIKDLKEEEDKVARYWSDLESDHQTTFLRTQRRLDNTMERRVEAEERRRGKPLWNHHHTRNADGPDYLALRMEVPVWMQQKYRSTGVSTKNDQEMQSFLRSATLFSPDSCRKTILDRWQCLKKNMKQFDELMFSYSTISST